MERNVTNPGRKNTKYNDARDRKRQADDKEDLFKVNSSCRIKLILISHFTENCLEK